MFLFIIPATAHRQARLQHLNSDFKIIASVFDLEEEKL